MIRKSMLISLVASFAVGALLVACVEREDAMSGPQEVAMATADSSGLDDWRHLASHASKQQLERGKTLFQMCASCHGIAEGEMSPAGPSLFGVAGRKVGGLAAYPYTRSLAQSKKYWTTTHFRDFIASPQEVYPGTGMAFAGIKTLEDREAITAYIASRLLGD